MNRWVLGFVVPFLFLCDHGLSGHETKEAATWRVWVKPGLASSGSATGPTGLFRINRITENTFHDLRFSGYGLEDDSYFYLRFKSSNKYRKPLDRLYYFSTLSFQRNTRTNIAIRYHYNQGFGYFASQYGSGHINAEIGHAFDMADYLNDTRKASYIKSGIYWDHDAKRMSFKLEAEYFYQISEVIMTDNLSRYEVFISARTMLTRSLSFVIGYEYEQIQDNHTSSGTVLLLLGWNQKLKWNL